MKNFLRFGAASAIVAASLGMSTVAQAQDNASAEAFAEILTALQLENDAPLNFGAMVVGGVDTVTLDAATGDLTCGTTGDIVCSGTTQLANFNILSGTGDKAVTIVFDTPSVTLLRIGGSVTEPRDVLELDNFNSDATKVEDLVNGDYFQVTLTNAGDASFKVGGDLSFDGDEFAGLYEGTFDVSVEYN